MALSNGCPLLFEGTLRPYQVEGLQWLNVRTIAYTQGACTLAENRPKLADFLIGRSFSEV